MVGSYPVQHFYETASLVAHNSGQGALHLILVMGD